MNCLSPFYSTLNPAVNYQKIILSGKNSCKVNEDLTLLLPIKNSVGIYLKDKLSFCI